MINYPKKHGTYKHVILLSFFQIILLIFLSGCLNEEPSLKGKEEEKEEEEPEIPLKKEVKDHLIAHRGLWNIPNSTQNSLTAIKEAIAIGASGAEIDVHETSDGILVINHDDTFNGLNISQNSFQTLSLFKLSNGERIPTLQEALEVVDKESSFKLILEIKNANPQKVINEIKRQDKLRNVEIYSFYEPICEEFINIEKNVRTSLVCWVVTENLFADLNSKGYSGVSVNYKSLETDPSLIQTANKYNLSVDAWTVNDISKIQELVNLGINYIYTDNSESFTYNFDLLE